MMKPTAGAPASPPVIPAQPAQEYYGIQELALFKNFTRESYRSFFGQEPPPFDPANPPKMWFDSTADLGDPENVSIYKIIARDKSGNWGVRQMLIPSAEASRPNLPGEVLYPKYVVAPTAATRGSAPINPNYLSLASDALALSAEVGGSGVVEEILMMFPASYPQDENRRVWNIMFGSRLVNAGLLQLQRHAKGYQYPGHWDLSGEEPAWVPATPAPTGLDETRPARDMPVRDLLPNEKLQTGLMGVGVLRVDLQSQSAAASGQFTPGDRAMLKAIFDAMTAHNPVP